MKYRLLIWKRCIEALIIFPFALAGRLIARFSPLRGRYDIFFFFPFYHVGGAEKVHSTIVQLFPGKKVILFFTRRSVNDAMLGSFEGTNITIRDISRWTDNKYLYFLNLIFRGILAHHINRQQAVVFNGQCNFAYKLSPHISRHLRQIELIHSFCSFSYIRLPFIPFYETTVMISHESVTRHLELYERLGVPAAYAERIRLILNGIPLPEDTTSLAPDAALHILYVGRGTAEKRAHLVAAITAAAAERGLSVKAGFMGPVKEAVPEKYHAHCIFYGEQTDVGAIDRIYRQHHVIVITSEREGFPMVIMEGMARGLAVLSTDVGDIPYHVKPMVNGLLIDHRQAEAAIVQQGVDQLTVLVADRALVKRMGAHNIAYAREHFGMTVFADAYRGLIG